MPLTVLVLCGQHWLSLPATAADGWSRWWDPGSPFGGVREGGVLMTF